MAPEKPHPIQVLLDAETLAVANAEAARRGVGIGPLFRSLLYEATNRPVFDAWSASDFPGKGILAGYDGGGTNPHYKLLVRDMPSPDGIWCWATLNNGGGRGFTGPMSLEGLYGTGLEKPLDKIIVYLRGDGFWRVTRRLTGMPGSPVNLYLARLDHHPDDPEAPKAKKK